ncbi:hypothetical protein T459_09435 [Capsicum annuum]|uniref:Uncharacterized protein n=1 Tax=Capsicum annuum TaxID=4072 RepID=A0A2G2ZZC8_CAPAN|nr:hypothetical protein FXO37_20732 [Capsicum annuum]PHT87329.1 hypothetical protein T459_09435 [Capsicum annuum]
MKLPMMVGNRGRAQMPNQQQMQQFKGLQDLKQPPQFKNLKLPPMGKDQNKKAVKFVALPMDDDLTDDEDDEDDF